jgi:8-oxo-dGTP diphosphatase
MSSPQRPEIRVVSAEVSEDGYYLVTQRLPTATLPMLWEFPGGRVREGESDVQALTRALRDRLGVAATVGERVLEVTHEYDHYDLVLVVYRVVLGGHPRTRRVHALAWVAPEDFGRYPFPGADQQTVDALLGDG